MRVRFPVSNSSSWTAHSLFWLLWTHSWMEAHTYMSISFFFFFLQKGYLNHPNFLRLSSFFQYHSSLGKSSLVVWKPRCNPWAPFASLKSMGDLEQESISYEWSACADSAVGLSELKSCLCCFPSVLSSVGCFTPEPRFPPLCIREGSLPPSWVWRITELIPGRTSE